MDNYDEIVVGGGSAGATLATRLSEDTGRRVLLVEAGPDPGHVTDADRFADQLAFSTSLTGWGTQATFVPDITTTYPQGRGMGGGSAVNGGYAVRGVPDDYQRWAAAGGSQWDWEHMLPVLRRLETDLDLGGQDLHGSEGPIPVVRWTRDELLPAQQAFLSAVLGHGFDWTDDHNAPDAVGIGVIPMNRQDGVRMSTALTYLPLARGRSNLAVRPCAEATRVLVEGGRAVGVEFIADGRAEQVRGARIILCAGALQSPVLLQRSGIGPAAELERLGIDCLVDLPGVGENLVDHPGGLVYLVPRDDQLDPTGPACQLAVRFSSGAGAEHDLWMSLWSCADLDLQPQLRAALDARFAAGIVYGVHDPESRGRLQLVSADPAVRPQVDFRMLSDRRDLDRMVDALDLVLDMATGDVLGSYAARIGPIQPDADRAAKEAYVRSTTTGWFHASGTCRMGPDPDGGAVVDGDLAVYGVSGLHVVDASVLPTVTRAPTNLSVIALGERAAELLTAG